MDIQETGLPGCVALRTRILDDPRGWFAKTFHEPTFEVLGLRTDWREEFCSLSHRGILRGMHFQTPPAGHAKLVYCLAGEVMDVVLDLRRGSPTYGEYRVFNLSPAQGVGLYIPTGCAHGFLSLTDNSLMIYKVTSVHAPSHDAGVRWDSFGFDWPIAVPLLSDRDQRHPPLADFDSPFTFHPTAAAQ